MEISTARRRAAHWLWAAEAPEDSRAHRAAKDSSSAWAQPWSRKLGAFAVPLALGQQLPAAPRPEQKELRAVSSPRVPLAPRVSQPRAR
jgi:hypothetical protein